MLRVAVVGTSCSGKTTLARKIAILLAIPHIELDALYWGPNWTPVPPEVFYRTVSERAIEQAWVMDGNYSKVREIIWSRATHLVWLNLPFVLVFWRALSRTLRRAITQEELFAGNRETFGLALFHDDSILWWVIRTHYRRRREYRRLIDSGLYPHLRVYEVRNTKDLRGMLEELSDETNTDGQLVAL